MYCGLCIKRKADSCYRKKKGKPQSTNTRRYSKCCHKFMINTRKIPTKVLQEAIALGYMPKSHIEMLIALLDQGIRLKAQNLRLGLYIKYEMAVQQNAKPTKHKVHLISAPKNSEEAYGVIFLNKPRKSAVSVTLSKELFVRRFDELLMKWWKRIEYRFMLSGNQDPGFKKFWLLRLFKILGKAKVDRMLKLHGIDIRAKSRRLEDTVDIVLRTYL